MNNLKTYNMNYNVLPFKRRPEQAFYFPTVDMTFAQYTTTTGRRSSILENGYDLSSVHFQMEMDEDEEPRGVRR